MALPGVHEGKGAHGFGFGVMVKEKAKGFAWSWKERVDPRRPRVENLKVLAVRVASLTEKDLIISRDPRKFFTEPHYNGFPAVLVRLDEVKVAELRPLLEEAHRCMVEATPAKGSKLRKR